MAIIHEATKEVICKIVYHGAGRCGKTTSLLYMNHDLPEFRRGQFVTLETPTERTLFFDFLPVMTRLGDYKFRHLLFATPGQEYYDASRRLILKGADAIVFVVDCQRERIQDNWEALELLDKNLKELGQRPEAVPMVIQYNKRDLSAVIPVEDAERRYNKRGCLSFPAVARTGQGVYETFRTVAKMAVTKLSSPSAEAAMGELFRTTVIGEDDAATLATRLERLNREAGIPGSVLVDEGTGIIASSGRVPAESFESLGALLACNFTAAQELTANLSARGFAGVSQKGTIWYLRAARVDQRRFLVLVCGADVDRRKVRDTLNYFRAPLAGYLKQMDSLSAGRLNRFSDMVSAISAMSPDPQVG